MHRSWWSGDLEAAVRMGAQDNARLAVKLSADRHQADGAWWPRSRVLAVELPTLLSAWPVGDGYISRVIYSVHDWEDRPRSVLIPNRRGLLKTGNFPTDDRHQLVITMLDGQRRALVVIPPSAPEETALRYLRHFDPRAGGFPEVSVATTGSSPT
jgi:hypothetical protein